MLYLPYHRTQGGYLERSETQDKQELDEGSFRNFGTRSWSTFPAILPLTKRAPSFSCPLVVSSNGNIARNNLFGPIWSCDPPELRRSPVIGSSAWRQRRVFLSRRKPGPALPLSEAPKCAKETTRLKFFLKCEATVHIHSLVKWRKNTLRGAVS